MSTKIDITTIIEAENEKKQKIENADKVKQKIIIEEYYKRLALIKSKYPAIEYDDTIPLSIYNEYKNLIFLINCFEYKLIAITYEDTLIGLNNEYLDQYNNIRNETSKLHDDNLNYIPKEDEDNFQYQKTNFNELKNKIDKKDKNQIQLLNKYYKRLAVIEKKYPLPHNNNIPYDIIKEYKALIELIQYFISDSIGLINVRGEFYFYDNSLDTYEKVTTDATILQEKNKESKHISEDDEKNFQYPEFNFNNFKNQINEINTNTKENLTQLDILDIKLQQIKKQTFWPIETQALFQELEEDINNKIKNLYVKNNKKALEKDPLGE